MTFNPVGSIGTGIGVAGAGSVSSTAGEPEAPPVAGALEASGETSLLASTAKREYQTHDSFEAALGCFKDKVKDGKPITLQDLAALKSDFSYPGPFTLKLSIKEIHYPMLKDIIARFPNIEVPIALEGIKAAASSQNYEGIKLTRFKLDLSYSNISDKGLASIVTIFPNIIEINLNDCDRITDVGLASLANLSNLNRLSLWGCDGITDAGLLYLSGLAYLTKLDLSYCTIGGVTLGSLENLTSLNLTGCTITDEGLASLASLKNLTSLDLTSCRVTDDWLAFLAIFLKNLTDLNLSGCNQISEGGLASLASGSNLTSLSLGQCGITDGALACLIPLSQLATLSLAGNELITNLAPLANLTHLTTLHLDWCKGIDAAELQSLRERLPNLRITQFLYLSQ